MRTETLIKTFHAPAAVAGYTLVTFAAGVNTVETADNVADPILGLTTSVGSQGNGRCDVIVGGVSEARIGGTVTKGEVLTTDATGRAITATQTTDRVLGMAMADAVIGDIASILVAQG
jgi:hypothetical protein